MSAQVATQVKGARLTQGPSPWIAAPALAFFGFFALIPLVGVFVLSFMSWDGLGTISFTGLSNWKAMLSKDRKSVV